MARDSLFGETILWSGRPKVLSTPEGYRLAAAVLGVMALLTLAFAALVGIALHRSPGSMLLFAAWCSTLALAAWRGPLLWRSEVEYLITDRHIIWRRGRIRRSIDRAAISYALIRWNPNVQGVGDLVVVRAVPTGALRRTLTLTLSDVAGPDRLWAIARGLTPGAPLGNGARPLAQRLDDGERVVWTGTPLASPWTMRRVATATLALILALAAVRVVTRAFPPLRRVVLAHALPAVGSGVLIASIALTTLLLLAIAGCVAYAACVRPARLARDTRYLVTNRRVLIRRGTEELSLDRARIAYVIAAPTSAPRLANVFLVLDGPQARALAPSGAFGGGDGGRLLPVLSAIEDADTVGDILRGQGEREAMRDAA